MKEHNEQDIEDYPFHFLFTNSLVPLTILLTNFPLINSQHSLYQFPCPSTNSLYKFLRPIPILLINSLVTLPIIFTDSLAIQPILFINFPVIVPILFTNSLVPFLILFTFFPFPFLLTNSFFSFTSYLFALLVPPLHRSPSLLLFVFFFCMSSISPRAGAVYTNLT